MSGRRPLYFRILGVRHLRLRPLVVNLLFDGSIALGLVLALADIVSMYGIIAIPIAVALLVKFNDVVAGAFVRPYALAQLRTPRPRDMPAVGRSEVRARGVATVPSPSSPPRDSLNRPANGPAEDLTKRLTSGLTKGLTSGLTSPANDADDDLADDPDDDLIDHEPRLMVDGSGRAADHDHQDLVAAPAESPPEAGAS